MNETLLWMGILLVTLGLGLVFAEVFVPSGGLIALCAAGCFVSGVVCLFRYDTMWGLAGLLAVMLAGPLSFSFALKVWPHTRLGKKMMGVKSEEQLERERLDELRERERWASFIGREGRVVVDLRPAGIIEIAGERHEATAEAGLIPAGSRVKVTRVEDSRLKVREIA